MLVYKVAVNTFDCHALSELLLQSTLPVLQLQLTSTEDTAEGKTLHLIFFITYQAYNVFHIFKNHSHSDFKHLLQFGSST